MPFALKSNHSTVTDFARFLGRSTSQPRKTAVWYAKSCKGTIEHRGVKISISSGILTTRSVKELSIGEFSLHIKTTLAPRALTSLRLLIVLA